VLTALAAGHRALEALDGSGGAVRVVAALSESIYARAGEALVWLGGPRAMLHPRAVRVAVLPPARTHDTLALDLARSTRWEPPASALDARTVATFTTGCRALARDLHALGTPDGLAALLLQGSRPATTEAELLERALPAARALGAACARDDWRAAADAAADLIGLGPGLTPSGDDFVGGAFFARALLARAGLCDRDGWTTAATRIRDVAASRTHPISAALLDDLLRGEGWQPLHDLARALACADTAGARVAARTLVGLGHSSGWDLLAGFVTGAAPGIAQRPDPG